MQELFLMRESKSFQTNLSVSKHELAEDGRALFSAGYVKTLHGRNNPLKALFAKTMIKDKLIMALIGNGSSFDLSIDTFYHQLGEPEQIRL